MGADTSSVDRPDTDPLLQMLVVTTIALLPLPLGVVIWSTSGGAGDPNLRVSASPYDIPLLLLMVSVVPEMWHALLRRLRRPPSWAAWAAAVIAGWFLLTMLVHPNWRAVELLFHAVGGGTVAFLLLTRDRRFLEVVLLATAAVAAAQAVLGVVQSVTGDLIGIGAIEASTELWKVGQSHAGRGSFLHPYHLTTFLMLGLGAAWILRRIATTVATRRAALVMTGMIGVAIPLTFSRAALLALVVIVPVGLLGRERILAVALVLAVALGAVLGSSGWEERGETTADPSRVDSGRSERLSEARELFESEPLWGVGPGGYAIALSGTERGKLLPAHNVVAQIGAEAGLLGGVFATLGILALAIIAVRAGPLGIVVGSTVVNFHLLDAFPHVYPNGIVITAIWIGFLGSTHRLRRSPDPTGHANPSADEPVSPPRPSRAGGP